MIRLEHIKKIYNQGKDNQFIALKDISFEVVDGEMLAIMGKSGAGKSTLMHILGGIDKQSEGNYFFDEELVENLSEKNLARIRNEKVGIVMQNFALVEEFTALENILLPLDFSRRKEKNKYERGFQALEQVGMGDFADQSVKTMSGGQKQRVAIARAIMNDPELILADEPTGALDSDNAEIIMELLIKLNQTGKMVIIITHDKTIAEKCSRIIEIGDGKIISLI